MSKTSRQLATIMFTDIVGYSQMMNRDEQQAIKLRKEVERVITHLSPKYDGEVIQFYGDGALVMFDSNVEATQCAYLIQKTIHSIEGIEVRIGIHVGDVTLEGNQIYGETVNIASRIETFCIPGAVMFSDRVYEDLRNQPEFNCKSLGVFKLKNIRRPIRLYALVDDAINVPDAKELHGKGERSQKSIAVLPFVNMSAEPENEYFSDGISEEILNTLSKENALRVTARTSSFAYKGSTVDIREIGKALNVEYVLEGSVRKAGNRVRITAQLIRASEGYHLLSETYDHKLDNIFEVQDEIAHNIKNQLRKALGLESETQIVHHDPTTNIRAYQDYLKGIFHWNKYDAENTKKAIQHLDAAIRKDPGFAEAYAFKSFCYSFLGGAAHMDGEKAFPPARENAEKAISINPNLVEAHCARGLVSIFYEWDLVTAEEYFNRAKAINRQSGTFTYTYSLFLRATGRHIEAVEILEEAVVIDPVSLIPNAYLAEAYMANRQVKEAFAQLEHTRDLFPDARNLIIQLAWFFIYQGEYEKALEVARTNIPQTDPTFMEFVAVRGLLWGIIGNLEKANSCRDRLNEIAAHKPEAYVRFLQICIAYGLNDHDFIKQSLRAAAEGPKGGLILSFQDPFWKKVFEEPWLNEEVTLIQAKIIRE